MLFNQSVDLVHFHYHLKNKVKAEGTVQCYFDIVKKFTDHYSEITLENCNDFLIRFGIKKAGYNHYYALKLFIEYSEMDANIKKRVLEHLIKPKRQDPKTQRASFDDETLSTIVDKLELKKHKLIAKIQIATGLRASEVITLQKDNLTIEDNNIKLSLVGKAGKRNVTFIYDQELIDELVEFITKPNVGELDTEYIFMRNKYLKRQYKEPNLFRKMRVHYRKYWTDLKQALTTCGIDYKSFSTHDFRRHFAGKAYLKFDKDLQLLKRLLRHSSIDTTLSYLRYSGLDTKDALKDMQTKLRKYILIKDDIIENQKLGDVIEIEPSDIVTNLIAGGVIKPLN